MRLLVSVRTAAEAGAALAGGADIVDAKEPARGPLGPVAPATLRAIAAAVPAQVPLSVALGDAGSTAQLASAVAAAIGGSRRVGGLFLKLGFAGETSERVIGDLIAAAVGAVPRASGGAVIAAAYADHEAAGAAAPEVILAAAASRGAAGVLLDTWTKDGRDLLHWIPEPALDRWITGARAAGLLTAVAGSLGLEAASRLRACGADVLGVRGAACEGGRLGAVAAARVEALKRTLGVASAVAAAR